MLSWVLIAIVTLLLIYFFLRKHRSDFSSHPAPPNKPLYIDENVLFTVYRPKVIVPEKWYTLLAFAHLAERREGSSPEEPDPVAEVQRQARLIYGTHLDGQLSTQQQSTHAVPQKGQITFVPQVEGIEFNPQVYSLGWLKDVHRVEFDMRASAKFDLQVVKGCLTVFLGSLVLADVPLSIHVNSESATIEVEENLLSEVSRAPYRKIFASYSHQDVHVIEEFETYVEALGDRYLRDVKTLRAGEVWGERLREFISDAEVFQLFWSSNSMHSEFVKQEWEYALSLNRPNFIRPVFWEEPMPKDKNLPPEELLNIHFYKLPTTLALPRPWPRTYRVLTLASITVVACTLMLATGPFRIVNRVRAKNSLYEGARAYKDGRFAEAEQKFREAYERDPTQKNALIFVARAVQQQYKPGVQTPENLALGEKAVAAYQSILDQDPGNEDAYKAIVFLYTQMENEDKVNQLLAERARSGPTPKSKAQALTILASKQWNCSYEITEQKENKVTENKPDKILVHYRKPANQADFDKAQQCTTQGLQLAEQATSLDPENPNAWSYKANLLREKSKLAEMDGDAKAKENFDNQYAAALDTQHRLADAEAKKKEAEEAAKSPVPPAS